MLKCHYVWVVSQNLIIRDSAKIHFGQKWKSKKKWLTGQYCFKHNSHVIVVGKWSLASFRIVKTSMEAEYHRHEVHCGHRSTSHTYK